MITLFAGLFVVLRHGLRPLVQLSQAAGRIANGDLEVRIREAGPPEMQGLITSFNRMTTAIRELIAKENEQRHAIETLHERYSTALAGIHEGLVLFDADDRLVFCNDRFRAIYSLMSDLIVPGVQLADLVRAGFERGQVAAPVNDADARLSAGLVAHGAIVPTPRFLPLSDDRWVRIAERRTSDGGTVGLHSDVTEELKIERLLREAKDQAEAGSRAKSEFLAKMSHDLRTPLTAVLGFSEFLLLDGGQEALTPKQRNAVSKIERSAIHLVSMVEEILDLARIENRSAKLATEAVSLPTALAEVLDFLRPAAKEHNVAIDHENVRADLPDVIGDRSRIIQVLTNLISNAVKYGRAGGRVVVSAQSTGDEFVRVAVTDFGPGIPDDFRERLFLPFSYMSQDGVADGTGIGLSISKELVEQMGGSIGVDSQTGKTEFWFILRASAIAATPTSDRTTASVQTGRVRTLGDVGPVTVLYVDDTEENRELVHRLLERFDNVRYLEADGGDLGVAIARRERPDLILMDLRMPGMNGFETLGALRTDPATSAIPVIALTGAAMSFEQEEIAAAGFDGYVTKPFRVASLFGTLVEALDLRDRNTVAAHQPMQSSLGADITPL